MRNLKNIMFSFVLYIVYKQPNEFECDAHSTTVNLLLKVFVFLSSQSQISIQRILQSKTEAHIVIASQSSFFQAVLLLFVPTFKAYFGCQSCHQHSRQMTIVSCSASGCAYAGKQPEKTHAFN